MTKTAALFTAAILAVSIGFTGYASAEAPTKAATTATTPASEWPSVAKESIAALKEGVGGLAEMLTKTAGSAAELIKQVAPEAWRVLIRQQIAEGIVGLAISVLILSLCFGGYVRYSRLAENEPDKSRRENYELTSFCLVIVCVISFCLCVPLACHGILQLVNPEYYAAQNLVNLIKSLK